MSAAKEQLQFRLSAALKAALVGRQAVARHHCLLAYAAISDAQGAEQASIQSCGIALNITKQLKDRCIICHRMQKMYLEYSIRTPKAGFCPNNGVCYEP